MAHKIIITNSSASTSLKSESGLIAPAENKEIERGGKRSSIRSRVSLKSTPTGSSNSTSRTGSPSLSPSPSPSRTLSPSVSSSPSPSPSLSNSPSSSRPHSHVPGGDHLYPTTGGWDLSRNGHHLPLSAAALLSLSQLSDASAEFIETKGKEGEVIVYRKRGGSRGERREKDSERGLNITLEMNETLTTCPPSTSSTSLNTISVHPSSLSTSINVIHDENIVAKLYTNSGPAAQSLSLLHFKNIQIPASNFSERTENIRTDQVGITTDMKINFDEVEIEKRNGTGIGTGVRTLSEGERGEEGEEEKKVEEIGEKVGGGREERGINQSSLIYSGKFLQSLEDSDIDSDDGKDISNYNTMNLVLGPSLSFDDNMVSIDKKDGNYSSSNIGDNKEISLNSMSDQLTNTTASIINQNASLNPYNDRRVFTPGGSSLLDLIMSETKHDFREYFAPSTSNLFSHTTKKNTESNDENITRVKNNKNNNGLIRRKSLESAIKNSDEESLSSNYSVKTSPPTFNRAISLQGQSDVNVCTDMPLIEIVYGPNPEERKREKDARMSLLQNVAFGENESDLSRRFTEVR